MSATNGIGYEVQAFDPNIGWCAQGGVFPTMNEARVALAQMPADGIERRVYEALS